MVVLESIHVGNALARCASRVATLAAVMPAIPPPPGSFSAISAAGSVLCVYTSIERGSSPSTRAVSSGFSSGLAYSTHSFTVSAEGLVSFGNSGSASEALSGIVPVATTIVA